MQILFKKNVNDKKIVLLQGVNGRKLIEKTLQIRGVNVTTIECYQRIFKEFNSIIEAEKWRSYKINTLVVTSTEMMYQLYHIFSKNKNNKWLFQCTIFVVENRLAEVAKELGWTDIIISKYANNEYLLDFIKEIHFKKKFFGRRKRI